MIKANNPKCPHCGITTYSDGGQAFPNENLLLYCPYKCCWWRGWTVNHRDISIRINKDGKEVLAKLHEVPEVTNYISLCSLTACHYINIYVMPASLNFAVRGQINGWVVEFCGREIHQVNLVNDNLSATALLDLWQKELSKPTIGWHGYMEPEFLSESQPGTMVVFETRRH